MSPKLMSQLNNTMQRNFQMITKSFSGFYWFFASLRPVIVIYNMKSALSGGVFKISL